MTSCWRETSWAPMLSENGFPYSVSWSRMCDGNLLIFLPLLQHIFSTFHTRMFPRLYNIRWKSTVCLFGIHNHCLQFKFIGSSHFFLQSTWSITEFCSNHLRTFVVGRIISGVSQFFSKLSLIIELWNCATEKKYFASMKWIHKVASFAECIWRLL